MVSKIHVYDICMHVLHHCIVYPLCMLYNRYSRFTEPWGSDIGALHSLDAFNLLTGILFLFVFVAVVVLTLGITFKLCYGGKRSNTSLGYYAADSSHALLLWRHCIFLLHCQSSVWTVFWISAGPSQLLQSRILLFICVCCDCSSLCFLLKLV